MSYTAAALAWADEVGMALFRFDHAGAVGCRQRPAEGRWWPPAATAVLRPPAWPVRLSDRAGRAAIARERRGLLFAERVAFVGLGWVWIQRVQLDYTIPTRRAVAHRATTLAFDLVSGAPFPAPGFEPEMACRDGGSEPVGETGPLPATMETAANSPSDQRYLGETGGGHPAGRGRTAPGGAREQLGVPPEALTISPSAGERVLAPVFVGLLEHRRDSRVVVCSGVTGATLSDLASHLTSRLPGALEEIVSRIRRL